MRVFSVLIRLDGGGAERSVSRMIEPLERKGVRLIRYAIDPALPGEEAHPQQTLVGSSRRGLLRLLAAALALSAEIRRDRPEIVHLNCEAPEFVGLLAKLLTLRIPYGIVVTEHSMNSWSGWKSTLGLVVRSSLRVFGAVYINCFKSDDSAKNIPVILNPTGPVYELAPSRSSFPRLVVIGRVINSKRIDEVLTAAASAGWPHDIVVIGGGQALGRLRGRASELGLAVNFMGHQEKPWSHVQESDIFVTASAYEGEPLTLIEALQRELPVLASDIPAHSHVLGSHPGLFTTTVALSDLLVTCMEFPQAAERFRLPAAALAPILELRNPERIAEQWLSVYSRCRSTGAFNGR